VVRASSSWPPTKPPSGPFSPRGGGAGGAGIVLTERRDTDESKHNYYQARTGSTGAWSDIVLGSIG
jgi:hypothetical protein